jgi:hypothetical protein
MLRAHHLAAVRICLLITGFALLGATSALATSTHRPRAATASRLRDSSHAALASQARPPARKSSSPPRARCVVMATRARKHHKATTLCAAAKPKAVGAKPSRQPAANVSATTSAASAGPQASVMGGALPTEALEVPASEPGPPAKAPVEASPAGTQSTTTRLASSLDPSMVGQAVTYTATVNTTAATGSVTFDDAGTAVSGCAAQTVRSGVATCAISGYALASTHAITAIYNGDSDYTGSASPLLNQVVSRAHTSTTLASSVNPSMVRQPVTYTATVSPAAGTGTVAFDEAGAPIPSCTAQPIGAGTATCTVSGYSTADEHAITATYSGDDNYLDSASSSKQVVDKTGTNTATMTLASSLNPATIDEAVTYTATLNTAAATGTVEFKQAGATIAGCVAQVISDGTATCTATALTAGNRWTTAAVAETLPRRVPA